MTHPLTKKICNEIEDSLIQWSEGVFGPTYRFPDTNDRMRAAYDKGFDDAIECIRRAGLAHYSALYEAQENFYKQQQENQWSTFHVLILKSFSVV